MYKNIYISNAILQAKGPNRPRENDFKASFAKRPLSPICPPPPDLSHLSTEELTVLNDVLRRQEMFEIEEKERIG